MFPSHATIHAAPIQLNSYIKVRQYISVTLTQMCFISALLNIDRDLAED